MRYSGRARGSSSPSRRKASRSENSCSERAGTCDKAGSSRRRTRLIGSVLCVRSAATPARTGSYCGPSSIADSNHPGLAQPKRSVSEQKQQNSTSDGSGDVLVSIDYVTIRPDIVRFLGSPFFVSLTQHFWFWLTRKEWLRFCYVRFFTRRKDRRLVAGSGRRLWERAFAGCVAHCVIRLRCIYWKTDAIFAACTNSLLTTRRARR